MQELEGLVLLGEQPLDVMRILSNYKICKREIPQGKLVLSYELVQCFQLRSVLLNHSSLGSFVILVEVQPLDCSSNLGEDRQETLQSGIVLDVLTQEFLVAPLFDDVALDGIGFCDVELSIQQVGQVGEVNAEVQFVLLEPVIRVAVVVILKCYVGIGEEQSWDLGQASDSPICQLHPMVGWLDRHHRRHEWSSNCIRSIIVGPHSWQFLEISADPPPEGVIMPLSREDSLEVVQILRQEEISQRKIPQREGLIPHKILKERQLRQQFRQDLSLSMLPLRVPKQSSHLLEHIIDHPNDILNNCLILHILTKQLLMPRSLDHILRNGNGFSQPELTIDQVWDVGEVEAQIFLVLFKPLLGVGELIEQLLEGSVCVGQKKSDVLGQASYFPVPEGHSRHKICKIYIGLRCCYVINLFNYGWDGLKNEGYQISACLPECLIVLRISIHPKLAWFFVIRRSRVLVGLPVANSELHLSIERPGSFSSPLRKHKLPLIVEIIDSLICIRGWCFLLVLCEPLALVDDRILGVCELADPKFAIFRVKINRVVLIR